MIETTTIISAIAAITSLVSLYFTRRFWLLTNRPIVTAEIVEHTSGVGIVVFDLLVYNSGNRPAVNIKLRAESKDIDEILSEKASNSDRQFIHGVFSEPKKIALLRNGKEPKTAFGAYSENSCNGDILKYQAELPIKIIYQDINGKNYIDKIVLYVCDAEGFGGATNSLTKRSS
jgi:hypothetical protein